MPGVTDLLLTERRAQRCRLATDESTFLLAHYRPQLDLFPEGGRVWRVTPAGVCGVIVTPRRRIVIRPRVPAANLPWLMGMREGTALSSLGIEAALDIAALALADEMDTIAAAGLHRSYRQHRTLSTTLTGTLDSVAQMRAPPERRALLHGIADDLTTQIPCNQIPASLARRLLNSTLSDVAKGRLRSALVAWPEQDDISLSLDAVHAPLRYGSLLRLCRSLTSSPGLGCSPSLLVSMERVWEGHLFRLVQSTDLECEEQRTFTACMPVGTRPGVALRPDVTIFSCGRAVLALDAKWKRLPDAAVLTSDFYQALAYATALGCRRAFLVHPGRRRSWDFALGGVEIHIRAIPVCGQLHRCRNASRRLAREILRRACA